MAEVYAVQRDKMLVVELELGAPHLLIGSKVQNNDT